ncbi:MAG TPA: DUF84 family protein [Candidatus Saccharimonadales bacterium]|nr:DUF84 family protein [Candidatus Saccharimonadales bacterium]
MKLAVATNNAAKLQAVKATAASLLGKIEVGAVSSTDGFEVTPMDNQIQEGALMRATSAGVADISIGIESGLAKRYGSYYEETWCCAIFRGRAYYAYSSGVKIPDAIAGRLEAGEEHTKIMQGLRTALKLSNDAWGNYTDGALSRRLSFDEAVRNCLVQIKIAEGIA